MAGAIADRDARDRRGSRHGLLDGPSVAMLILSILLASDAEARVSVSIRARSEVAPGLVRLGDIASVEGDDPALVGRVRSVLLGRAPAGGDVRTVSRARAESRLRREGLSAPLVRVAGEPFTAVSLPRIGDAAGAAPAPQARLSVEVRARTDVRSDDFVRTGETVTVSAGTARLRITDRARAETAGTVGDVIVVRNMRSGGTYRARVTGAGRVEAAP